MSDRLDLALVERSAGRARPDRPVTAAMVAPEAAEPTTPADLAAGGQDAVRVAPGVAIRASELSWRFSASSGPGGQHVNTSNTRAEVTFDVLASPSLPEWAKRRIVDRLGPRVRVAASDERSQARNRDLATERLAARLAGALKEDRPRRPTRPTAASKRRRLEQKRRRSAQKRQRRTGRGTGEDE